ncbi:MAG: efflux RND transporter periplasmic adaptor subunit [Elusimicrobiaceae bacterium]|nr:efflux RND transporter periplasmic adaptor subunit [Elusimicrobiaceae bacterium]
MKKLSVLIIIFAVAGAGFYFYKTKTARKNGVVHYAAVTAARDIIRDTVETTGEVAPLNRVEVKPSVAGRVDRLLVDEGAFVKKGQILAYMSSTDRVAILDAARASGEDVAKWEDTYKPTPIISPLSGTIILRNVVPGETVTATTVLYAIADDLIVVASVDETDVGRVKVGQKTEISLDAYSDKKVRGSVFQILYEGTNSSNVITYKTKVRPVNTPSYFKSQMTANISIITDQKSSLVLPWDAVQENADGSKYVITRTVPDLQKTPVTTGIQSGNNVEILSGLKDGDTVYMKQADYAPQVADTKGGLMSFPKRSERKTAVTLSNGKNKGKKVNASKNDGPPPM